MTISTATRLFGLASLGILLAAPAAAQSDGHYYGGISVGRSDTEIDPGGQTSSLLPGVSATSSTTDPRDTAYKLFGGYQFNRNFALEGGYFNMGNSSFNANTSPAGTLAGETKAQGINLDLVGTMPLTNNFSLLGRVGAHHTWSKSTYSGTGAGAGVIGNSKRSGSDYKVGLGMQYEFNPSVWLRGEVERYRVKDAVGRRANVDMVTVSLVFPFGYKPMPRQAAAPRYVPPVAPAPVAAAPVYVAPVAPPPAPAPVVVAPPVQRISLSTDAMFGSNQYQLRERSQADLDRFSQQLIGATYESIRVEGHTDRMGSNEANQQLSERRAASVKDYLVINGRIDPARISTVGRGETMPVTAASDCSDRLPRARLIECLQPDRRVEIEVTGTR